MSEGQFLQTILVLPVRNIEESTDWYNSTLGFETRYLHQGDHEGEPTNYAIMQRDTALVHFILDEQERKWAKAGSGYLYLTVRDVDAVFDDVQASGAKIDRGLQTENWGARGFNLTDPSHNAIHIEQST